MVIDHQVPLTKRVLRAETNVVATTCALLIQCAKAAVLAGKHSDDPISQWAERLRERGGWQKAAVALANKNARILWAVMTGNKRYDAHHVSVLPTAGMPTAA